MAKHVAAKCCPACSGTTGHEHVMTESHLMHGTWGGDVESGDCGPSVAPTKRSLVKCKDCGATFKFESLRKNGLAL